MRKMLFAQLLVLLLPIQASASTKAQGQIAYLRLTDGFWQAWVVNPDATKQRQITFDKVDKTRVSWANEGKLLLVSSNDGSVLLVDIENETGTSIDLKAGVSQDAAIAPNGKYIAFSLKKELPEGTNDLWLYDMQTQTSSMVARKPLTQVSPSWNKESTRIVYQAGKLADSYNIWRLNVKTGNETQLTICRNICADPDFNAQGVVAYAADEAGSFDIWYLGDKGRPVSVTNSPAYEAQPSWSPDGKSIAYYSSANYKQRIWVINIASGEKRAITPDNVRSRYPAWSR